MTDARLVLVEEEGPVVWLTLNRPERHNSLVPALLAQMRDALATVGADADARVAILRARGRSFSTGGDARAFVEHADDVAAYASRIVGLLNEVMLALVDLPVPVIAAVHGIVTGGALGFVLGADIVLVTPEASFTPYYSVVGPSPDGGWATLLPLVIGHRRAAEVLFTNRTISAEEAVAWGLANRVVPGAALEDAARTLAQDIAAKKAGSIRHSKRLLHWQRDEIAARLEAERAHFVAQIVTEEGIGGFRDFLQQRQATREEPR